MRKFWKEKGVESGRGARKGKETKRRIEGNVSCWREPSTMLQQSTATHGANGVFEIPSLVIVPITTPKKENTTTHLVSLVPIANTSIYLVSVVPITTSNQK